MAITQQRCVCGLSTAERMNGASIVRGEHAWIDCVSVSMFLCMYNYVCFSRCVCKSTSVCNYPYVPASLCISLSLSLCVPVPLCPCLCVSMSVCVQMFVCCRFPTAWSVAWKVKCAQETDNKVQGMHWES